MTEQLARHRDTALLTDACRTLVAAAAKPRLLCATGLSQQALHVMARAFLMASQLDATLTLLHVMGAEPGSRASASERIRLQLKSLRPLVGAGPTPRLHAGAFVPTVASVAHEAGSDLVVLDSRPWKPLLSPIAATAAELAAQVGRPVLIVKRSAHAPYKSVLIAAEQSPAFDQVLRKLSAWRLLESGSVAVIHGFESPYRGPLYAAGFELNASRRNTEEWELAARRRLLLGLDELGVASDHFRIVFAQSRSIREIQRQVRRIRPDLLVIATRHHSEVDRVLRASVGNDLLRNIECDILAVPMNAS